MTRTTRPEVSGCAFPQRNGPPHAEKKAEVLGQKLEKAKAEVPKQYRPRIKREFDSATGKVRPTLHFEEEVRPRGKKNPAAKGALKAGRTADLAVHNKIRQVEHENVGTEAAHKTEFAAENIAAGAVKSGYRYAKDTPYRKVISWRSRVPKPP